MKREIKFKGKRVDNGEWIYGNVHFPNKLFTGVFICPDTTYGDIAPGFEDGDDFNEAKKHGCAIGHYHHVVPESVGEFTGLKDKNGKDIYEGDIVLHLFEGEYGPYEHRDTVEYYEGAYYPICEKPGTEFEVIGNIYENFKLL